MKTPISLTLLLLFAVKLSISVEAKAADHAVTAFAASPNSLVELSGHLPQELQGQLAGLASQAMGPLLASSSPDAPVGLWLDWQSDLPQLTLLVKGVNFEAFYQATQAAGIEPKQHPNGIFELQIDSPIFYRMVGEWLYVAASMEELQNVDDPMSVFPNGIQNDLVVEANLSRIPLGVRTEIASVLGKRLLAPPVAGPNEISGDTLVHLYATRALNELATLTETISLTIDSDASGLAINADVRGRALSQFVNQSPKMPLPGLKQMGQGLTVHTSLRDEEVANLTWWSQSVPEQIAGAFRSAEIEQAADVEGVLQISTLFSRLMREVAQSGEIEGFVTLLEDEYQTPILGARIKSGDTFENGLRKWVDDGFASQMGVRGVEYDVQRIRNLRVNRFTVGDEGEEPFALIVAIADDQMYATVGQEGLDALRDMVNQTPEAIEAPKPIQIRLNDVSLATLVGWEATEESLRRLELDSRYTDNGRRYELRLMAK